MLLYRSFKASFLVSAGKERFESSFRTESKKNLIFLFVLFRYVMRLTVRKTKVRIQIIEKRMEWSIMAEYPRTAENSTINNTLSTMLIYRLLLNISLFFKSVIESLPCYTKLLRSSSEVTIIFFKGLLNHNLFHLF